MATAYDLTQVRTDTPSPEVAKLLIAHNVATRTSWDAGTSRLDVDTYLGVFDKVYTAINATTTPAELPEEDVQKGGQGG